MSNSLASPGNGVTPRENVGLGQTFFDLSANNILMAVGPVVLQAGDCGKVVTNQGGAGAASTRYIQLPPIPATGSLYFHFYDQTGLGIEIVADGVHTIRVGAGPGNVTATGGNIVSQIIGSGITLRSVSTTEWTAMPAPPEPWTIN